MKIGDKVEIQTTNTVAEAFVVAPGYAYCEETVRLRLRDGLIFIPGRG